MSRLRTSLSRYIQYGIEFKNTTRNLFVNFREISLAARTKDLLQKINDLLMVADAFQLSYKTVKVQWHLVKHLPWIFTLRSSYFCMASPFNTFVVTRCFLGLDRKLP